VYDAYAFINDLLKSVNIELKEFKRAHDRFDN
jgi:hypothetical protein